jgi:hypothetical protein
MGANTASFVTTSTINVGYATTAANALTQLQTGNASYYPTFVDSNNATAAGMPHYTTSSFVINPATGNVSISGTVTGGSIRTNSTSTAPSNPTVGDIWYDTATDDIYRYTSDGTTSVWLDITGPTVANSSVFSASTATLYYRLNSDLAGANVNTAQNVLGVGVTLNSNTIYQFEAIYALSKTSGTTSHTIGYGFGGTATLNNIAYVRGWSEGNSGFTTAPSTAGYFQVGSFIQTAASTTLPSENNAVAGAYWTVFLRGTVSVNVGGTFIPQYTLSAAPGGAYTTAAGSYFSITPMGVAGANLSIGPWA